MSSSTQGLIKTAIERFLGEVPGLAKLKIVFELELIGRGDVQMFRVELPGPKITKAVAQDARVTITIPRAQFNELAEEGTLKGYHRAYDTGHIKVAGDEQVQKLIAQVIERQEERARLKKAH
jgi:hypothetical protein